MCYKQATQAMRKWGHYDSNMECPIPKSKSKPTDNKVVAIDWWQANDIHAKILLLQRLLDSIATCYDSLPTAKACWDALVEEYTPKGELAWQDLKQTFLESHCQKGGNVCAFLRGLQHRREELVTTSVTIAEDNYQWMALCGIPQELSMYASGMLASALVSNNLLTTNKLIPFICKEANRIKSWSARNQKP
jgi:hypothetical protein